MTSLQNAPGSHNPHRERFLATCANLELGVPYRAAAEQRRAIWTAIFDGFDAAGFAPVLSPDGGLSINLGSELVLVAFDTFPATTVDRNRRRALEAAAEPTRIAGDDEMDHPLISRHVCTPDGNGHCLDVFAGRTAIVDLFDGGTGEFPVDRVELLDAKAREAARV
jgi:hypothetical protein